MQEKYRPQTPAEEVANVITHMSGFILGIIALAMYTTLQGDIWQVVSLSVYGGTLLFLYLSSSMYHLTKKPQLKHFFRKLDHAAIYLFIAGCYTPLVLVKIRGTEGIIVLSIIWGLAILGVIKKLFFPMKFPRFSFALYLLMGWLVIVLAGPMIKALPVNAIIWMAAGGLCYMLGVIFYVKDKILFFHTIWHIFVLGGTLCHFYMMAFYVLPNAPVA